MKLVNKKICECVINVKIEGTNKVSNSNGQFVNVTTSVLLRLDNQQLYQINKELVKLQI